MSDWLPIEMATKYGNLGPLCVMFERAKGVYIARHCYGEWVTVPGKYTRNPTHWAPIPHVPKAPTP